MLAIFDIDGTICDSQQAEEFCFINAISSLTHLPPESINWNQSQDPTSSGVVRHILSENLLPETMELEIKERFIQNLEEAQTDYPQDFSPIPGAVEFIEHLRQQRICDVAIATGGYDSEARFKLASCGINLDDFPHATSSDSPKRQDILPLAASRAGYALSSCIYFGDAAWDIRVSQKLSIPLIGIGRKKHLFAAHASIPHFRDYAERSPITQAMNAHWQSA